MARSTGSNKTGAQCHQQKWRHAQVEWLAPSNLLENLSFKDFSMGTATNSSEFTQLEFLKKHPAMLIDLNYLKWHRSERHWKTRRTCVTHFTSTWKRNTCHQETKTLHMSCVHIWRKSLQISCSWKNIQERGGTLGVRCKTWEETHENCTLTAWMCGKMMLLFTSIERTIHICIISVPVFDRIVEFTFTWTHVSGKYIYDWLPVMLRLR